MKAVIIAAGRGGRLSGLGEPKPLVPLCGLPLIMHVMRAVRAGGIDELVVVTGYRHDDMVAFIDGAGLPAGLAIELVRNPHWQEGQHTSVLSAAPHVGPSFVLMMSDHLFDASILVDLAACPLHGRDLVLAVDRQLDGPYVDLDDVTRVETDGGRIVRIGKHLEVYDAFDTGLFLCGHALFDALESAHVEPTLSAGVQHLADRGRAGTFDIGARFWIDVDDERAHALCEAHLNASQRQ